MSWHPVNTSERGLIAFSWEHVMSAIISSEHLNKSWGRLLCPGMILACFRHLPYQGSIVDMSREFHNMSRVHLIIAGRLLVFPVSSNYVLGTC
jgi:hypothetical protein